MRSGYDRLAPTGRGYALAVCCVSCFVGGRLLGYPELDALGAACLAALVLAPLSLSTGRPPAVHRAVAPSKVERAGAAVGTLRVTNTGRRAGRPVSAVDVVGGVPVEVRIPALAGSGSREIGYQLPTGRRGRLTVGPLLLRADDAFGLVRRVRVLGDETEVLVRPRVAGFGPPPSGRRASLEGPAARNAPSGTATFHLVRAYVPGDDLRHVHWRTSARTNTLMIKQLVDSSLPETAVVLDTRASSYRTLEPAAAAGTDAASDFDVAVDAAATIAAGMARAGFPVLLLTTAGERMRVQGVRAVDVMLDRLALLEPDRAESSGRPGSAAETAETAETAGTALARALDRAKQGTAAHGGLAVVTGPRGELPGRGLSALGGRFERALVLRAGSRALDDGAEAVAQGGRPSATPHMRVLSISSAEEAAYAWRGDTRVRQGRREARA